MKRLHKALPAARPARKTVSIAENAYVVFFRYSKLKIRARDQRTCAPMETRPVRSAPGRMRAEPRSRSEPGTDGFSVASPLGFVSRAVRSFSVKAESAPAPRAATT